MDQLIHQFGNYRLIRLLGRGGSADVYLAEQVYLQTTVALKIFRARLDDGEMERFLAQTRKIASIQHPHIVRLLECAIHNSTPVLVMPYASCGTLRQRFPRGSQAPLLELSPYISQAADALDHVHRCGLMHGDVKGENLLLDGPDHLVLADIVHLPKSGPAAPEQDAKPAGTLLYMAPEQVQGMPCPASDQYALGIVVYEWLTGEPPFSGSPIEIATQHTLIQPPSLCEKRPDLPLAVEEVLLRALAKDPRDRFASVRAFAAALEEAAKRSPTQTNPGRERPPSEARAGHPISRRLLIVGLAGGALAIGGGVTWAALRATDHATFSSTPTLVTTTLSTYSGHGGPVSYVAWAPDGRRIASGDGQGNLHLWRWQDGTVLATHTFTAIIEGKSPHTQNALNALAWSPDNLRMVLGVSTEIHIWDSATGEDLLILRESNALGSSVAWSPDGTRFAATGQDQTVHGPFPVLLVWTADTGAPLLMSPEYYAGLMGPSGIAWSPDSRQIAWGSNGQISITTFQPTRADRHLNSAGVNALAWSQSGSYLASIDLARNMQIWDTRANRRVATYQASGARGLAWSPDGRFIASGNDDQVVRVWDTTSGSLTRIYRGHTGPVNAVSWSPDGAQIASASADGTVRVWKA